MKFDSLINWFIHPDYAINHKDFRSARLLVSACLLTSLFSSSYVLLSIVFDYEKGIYFTAFNVIGYFTLPFFVRTKLPLLFLGNIFTAIGATTVLALTWFSGGMWSAIYPWIIAIPVLGLLIAGRTSAIYWSAFSLLSMLAFGAVELRGIALPVEYNSEWRTAWFLCIIPGLMLIIMVVSMTFELSIHRALSDVEEQNATIEQQSYELEKLIEDKDNIIGILAHDLRNPLANIGILVRMLNEEKDEIQKKMLLDMIGKASSNAQVLVKNVLEMAELDHAGASLVLQPIRIYPVIQEVMESHRSAAKTKGIQINIEEFDETQMILADQTYFRQVIENLVSNALKFSVKEKDVEVIVVNDHKFIQIKVRDHGPGVPVGEETRLFKKFSRLSTQPTAGESSSGLGLSLVKRYMELMNGRVWHEHPKGNGAIFAVEFLKA